VADFLSDAWFAAINSRLGKHDQAAATILARTARKSTSSSTSSSASRLPVTVVIEMHAPVDAPQSHPAAPARIWHIRIDNHGARVALGAPIDGDTTLTIYTDDSTGTALGNNLTNAQRAIDAGTLRVRGDLNALATMTAVFTELSTLPNTR
jgi:SCP-2 sterol transfer family